MRRDCDLQPADAAIVQPLHWHTRILSVLFYLILSLTVLLVFCSHPRYARSVYSVYVIYFCCVYISVCCYISSSFTSFYMVYSLIMPLFILDSILCTTFLLRCKTVSALELICTKVVNFVILCVTGWLSLLRLSTAV